MERNISPLVQVSRYPSVYSEMPARIAVTSRINRNPTHRRGPGPHPREKQRSEAVLAARLEVYDIGINAGANAAIQANFTRLHTDVYQTVVDSAALKGSDIVLDLACGGGRIGKRAGQMLDHGTSEQVWFADVSLEMLCESMRLNSAPVVKVDDVAASHYLLADVTDRYCIAGMRGCLPQFDVVYCHLFLPFVKVKDRRQQLRWLLGLLRPGGKLVFDAHLTSPFAISNRGPDVPNMTYGSIRILEMPEAGADADAEGFSIIPRRVEALVGDIEEQALDAEIGALIDGLPASLHYTQDLVDHSNADYGFYTEMKRHAELIKKSQMVAALKQGIPFRDLGDLVYLDASRSIQVEQFKRDLLPLGKQEDLLAAGLVRTATRYGKVVVLKKYGDTDMDA